MNANIIEMVSSFAKQNKISKAKLQEFTDQVINTLPKGKVNSGKAGRPTLEKTQALYNSILEQLHDTQKDAVTVRNSLASSYPNMDKITFNNAVSALIKQGKIFHAGKAKTGNKGRQPFILTTNKPE